MQVLDATRRLVAPFLPGAVAKLNTFLEVTDVGWAPGARTIVGMPILKPVALFEKIDPEVIKAEIALIEQHAGTAK